jgi:hypothetical protein
MVTFGYHIDANSMRLKLMKNEQCGISLFSFQTSCSEMNYRLTQPVPLLEQEFLTLPDHLSSPPVFNGVRVTRSLVLYACFVDHCYRF